MPHQTSKWVFPDVSFEIASSSFSNVVIVTWTLCSFSNLRTVAGLM